MTNHADYQKPVVTYRDSGQGDVAETFILMMHEEHERLHDLLYAEEEMLPLTEEQQQAHDQATICYLCEKHLPAGDKVMDHCHYRLIFSVLFIQIQNGLITFR